MTMSLVGDGDVIQTWKLLLYCLMLLVLIGTVEACPNCKETIAGDPAQQGLAKGIYYSILFMMSMPFFILGGLCTYFYYLVRREKLKQSPQPKLQVASET